jgi:hypothetical protein
MIQTPLMVDIDRASCVPTLSDLSRVMGYRSLPESIAGPLDKLFPMFDETIDPIGGFALFQVESSDEAHTVINGVELQTDLIIGRTLAGATYLAVFAGTIGHMLEENADRFMRAGDTLLGYLSDLAGSTAAEKVAAAVHARVKEYALSEGFTAGNRYSPGYCGWDVAEQKKIFSLLPDGFCGIRVTDSSMMLPVKSVSGVIPVGVRVQHRPYACASCTRRECVRRSR